MHLILRCSFSFEVFRIIKKRRLPCVSKQPHPGSITFGYSVWLRETGDWDHCDVLIDVSDCECCKPCHGSMDCTRRQMSAHFAVISIGWYCSNHISRVNVLKGCFQLTDLTIFNNLCFQKLTNVLCHNELTLRMVFPEPSFVTASFRDATSRTPRPAPSATTITKCLRILSWSYM